MTRSPASLRPSRASTGSQAASGQRPNAASLGAARWLRWARCASWSRCARWARWARWFRWARWARGARGARWDRWDRTCMHTRFSFPSSPCPASHRLRRPAPTGAGDDDVSADSDLPHGMGVGSDVSHLSISNGHK